MNLVSAPVHAMVVIDGDIDLATIPGVRDACADALGRSEGPLVLDCSGVTFLDAAGIGTLVWCANQARDQGRRVRLHRPSHPVQWLLELTGVGSRFDAN